MCLLVYQIQQTDVMRLLRLIPKPTHLAQYGCIRMKTNNTFQSTQKYERKVANFTVLPPIVQDLPLAVSGATHTMVKVVEEPLARRLTQQWRWKSNRRGGGSV